MNTNENAPRTNAEHTNALKNELKEVWTVVSPLLTVFCMLACSMGALQLLSRTV